MALTTTIQILSTRATVVGLTTDEAQLTVPVQWKLNDQRTWIAATGAGGINAEWPYAVTLAASSVDFDLTALTPLLDVAALITLNKVRVIAVEASGSNAGALTIQPSSGPANPWAAPFGGPVVIDAGAKIVLTNPSAAGWPVSGGSKVLRIAGTVGDSFKIYLAGE